MLPCRVFCLWWTGLGFLVIVFGVSVNHPPWTGERWMSILCLGLPFSLVGVVGLVRGKSGQCLPPVKPEDRRFAAVLGIAIALFGTASGFGSLWAWPESFGDAAFWSQQAWWCPWAWAGICWWSAVGGLGLLWMAVRAPH